MGQSFTGLIALIERRITKYFHVPAQPVKPDAEQHSEVAPEEPKELLPVKKLNVWLLIVPSFFDVIENTSKNIALSLISSSVTQMMRSSAIVFTALFSVFFLKRRLYRQHWTGLVTMVLGICLVGVASMNANSSTVVDKNRNIWGITVLIIGQIFGASGYIIEEKLLGDFEDFDPHVMAGIEGMFAVVLQIVTLTIFQFIPCDDENLCQKPLVENTVEAFIEYQK